MVDLIYKEHRDLEFYAQKLFITVNYLSIIIKHVSGVTVKEWIDRATTTRAQIMLRHSNKQITEITDKLSFPHTSIFCKFFKRRTNLTPKEYREQQ